MYSDTRVSTLGGLTLSASMSRRNSASYRAACSRNTAGSVTAAPSPRSRSRCSARTSPAAARISGRSPSEAEASLSDAWRSCSAFSSSTLTDSASSLARRRSREGEGSVVGVSASGLLPPSPLALLRSPAPPSFPLPSASAASCALFSRSSCLSRARDRAADASLFTCGGEGEEEEAPLSPSPTGPQIPFLR